jgi:hypothetical protein
MDKLFDLWPSKPPLMPFPEHRQCARHCWHWRLSGSEVDSFRVLAFWRSLSKIDELVQSHTATWQQIWDSNPCPSDFETYIPINLPFCLQVLVTGSSFLWWSPKISEGNTLSIFVAVMRNACFMVCPCVWDKEHCLSIYTTAESSPPAKYFAGAVDDGLSGILTWPINRARRCLRPRAIESQPFCGIK